MSVSEDVRSIQCLIHVVQDVIYQLGKGEDSQVDSVAVRAVQEEGVRQGR